MGGAIIRLTSHHRWIPHAIDQTTERARRTAVVELVAAASRGNGDRIGRPCRSSGRVVLNEMGCTPGGCPLEDAAWGRSKWRSAPRVGAYSCVCEPVRPDT